MLSIAREGVQSVVIPRKVEAEARTALEKDGPKGYDRVLDAYLDAQPTVKRPTGPKAPEAKKPKK